MTSAIRRSAASPRSTDRLARGLGVGELLAPALRPGRPRRRAASAAVGMVAAVTLLDILCARHLVLRLPAPTAGAAPPGHQPEPAREAAS